MRYLLVFFLTMFVAGSGQAQSIGPVVINTTGNTFTQSGITYDWSLGEMVLVETMVNTGAIISNGFLQPILLTQYNYADFSIQPTNILSGNGDGKNDTWVIKELEEYPDNEVTVFDRSGRTIFHTKNYQNDWAGTFAGTVLAEGTYYYIIKLKRGGIVYLKKGYITII